MIKAGCAREYQNRISWALDALEKGADSESLRVLAGLALEKLPSPWEVDALFQQSLKELGWTPLRREELLRQHARDLCKDFLSNHLPPRQITHEMNLTAVELDYPKDLSA